MEPRCHNCRFWKDTGTNYGGDCRRHSPVPLIEADSPTRFPIAIWPVLDGDQWCGDHMPINEEK